MTLKFIFLKAPLSRNKRNNIKTVKSSTNKIYIIFIMLGNKHLRLMSRFSCHFIYVTRALYKYLIASEYFIPQVFFILQIFTTKSNKEKQF